MDGGYLPAVQYRNVAQMQHIRKMPSGDGDRIFLDLARPNRQNAVALGGIGEYSDPVKKAS